MHQFIYRECCSDSKPMMSPSSIKPGKKEVVPDAPSHCAPLKASEIPLDITINHVHIAPDRKTEFQTLIQDDLLLCSLAEIIMAGWPDDISDVPHALCPYHGHRNTLTTEDGLHPSSEALIILPLEREKILHAIYKGHMGIKKFQNSTGTVCIGLESTQTKSTSLNHAQWYSLVSEMWCGTMSIIKRNDY